MKNKTWIFSIEYSLTFFKKLYPGINILNNGYTKEILKFSIIKILISISTKWPINKDKKPIVEKNNKKMKVLNVPKKT